MSKSIGRIYGIGSMSPYGYETDYMRYLQGYNPYDYEQSLRNMSVNAVDLNVLPDVLIFRGKPED